MTARDPRDGSHPERHAGWLAAWEAEGLLDDPQRAELLECGECGDQARALALLEEQLARLGEREREAELAAAAAESVPGAEEADARLRAAMRGADAGAGGSGGLRRLGWLVAAAAAIVLAVVLIDDRGGVDDPSPRVLLGEEVELLEPVGAVDRYARFRWSSSIEAARYHELRVFDAADPGSALVTELFEDDEQEWTPPNGVEATLPARILWEVEVQDAGGVALGASSRREASRSPH